MRQEVRWRQKGPIAARSGRVGERNWLGYLYLIPGLVMYAAFGLYPFADTVRYSFYDWSGFGDKVFVGLRNYATLVHDEIFRQAIFNNFILIFFYTGLPILLALFLTVLMTARPLPGMTFFRAGLFIPYVIPMVVVGITWRWILSPGRGPLNVALRAVGLNDWAKAWLGDFTWALPALGSIGTWVMFGLCMVLFIAGVQNIDETLYDAAKIDGAGVFQQFRHVTLPGLHHQLMVALILTSITALRTFDVVWVTTRGGPANSTMVVGLQMYREAFVLREVGYAASMGVVMTVVMLAIWVAILAVDQRLRREGA